MKKLSIDLDADKIEEERRNKSILFVDNNFIVHKNGYYVEFWSCDDHLLNSKKCIADLGSYEHIELEDYLVFMIDNQYCLSFDKNNYEIKLEKIEFGNIISKIFATSEEDLIFMTLHNNREQVVKYNFKDNKRIAQSQSWDGNILTGFYADNTKILAIIDRSMIVYCDADTCRTEWSRFESGRIGRGVEPYEEGVLYVCQKSLRLRKKKQVETYQLPFAQVGSIEGRIKDMVYITSSNFNDLYGYNLKSKKVIWELSDVGPIDETIIGEGKQNGKLCNIGIMRSKNRIGIINLDRGQLIYKFEVPGAYKIKQTNNHLLINQRDEQSTFVAGI